VKLLTVIVPCFNSQDYMHNCIDSLLPGGSELEIILVNDGSTDNTSDIANDYAQRYPKQIQAIHQANAGHGGAINAGLAVGTGEYIKIVDSDDWVDEQSLRQIMTQLRTFTPNHRPDVLISNYVYEKVGKRRKTAMRYTNVFPQGELVTWEQTRPFRLGQYMMMHALMYRRDILAKSALSLPTHTFYVDSLYAYVPLAQCETLYYMNVDFYRYFIGRQDQSVQEKTMIRRVDQHLRVTLAMIQGLQLLGVAPRKKRDYLARYLEITLAISSVLLVKADSAESLAKKTQLWQHLHDQDKWLYQHLRYKLLGRLLHPRTRMGRYGGLIVYKVAQWIVGFN